MDPLNWWSRLSLALALAGVTLFGVATARAERPTTPLAASWDVGIVEPQLSDALSWGFDPSTITIAAGDTVHWVNQGKIDHSISASDQSFKSDVLHTGDAFDYTFTTPGTYQYVCGLHPTMVGTVVVQ